MATSPASGAPALTFTFSSQSLRCILRDGEPWFVAADVCEALSIANSRDAATRLDDDERGVATTDTPSGQQEMTIINESGLYSLILTSRKPEAKKFKKWVTSEVLPAIRKTGRYEAPQSQFEPAAKVIEYINGKDLQNIKRMIWFCTRTFQFESAWVQAIWFYLRKALGVPSPYPFRVGDLPRVASEMHRIAAIAYQVQEIIEEVERQAVKRIFRKAEDAEVVLADLRRLAVQRTAEIADERAKLPSWLQTDIASISDRYQHPGGATAYVDSEKGG